MTLVRSRDSGDPDMIDFMTVGAVWITVSPVEACTLRVALRHTFYTQ